MSSLGDVVQAVEQDLEQRGQIVVSWMDALLQCLYNLFFHFKTA